MPVPYPPGPASPAFPLRFSAQAPPFLSPFLSRLLFLTDSSPSSPRLSPRFSRASMEVPALLPPPIPFSSRALSALSRARRACPMPPTFSPTFPVPPQFLPSFLFSRFLPPPRLRRPFFRFPHPVFSPFPYFSTSSPPSKISFFPHDCLTRALPEKAAERKYDYSL